MASEPPGLVRVRRALLSVHDTRGLATFAAHLHDHGVELLATSGTKRHLDDAQLPARSAEELTGIGSWFGGRIKTLHPALLGGILAERTEPGLRELEQRRLVPIDLVAVNLYPFVQHLRDHPEASDREEFIDIGGVTLSRASAKNHAWVAAVTDPSDYDEVARELDEYGGALTAATRARLAVRAFDRCAAYDRAIAAGLGPASESVFPPEISFTPEPVRLRYGENPHQRAAVYRLFSPPLDTLGAAPYRLLKGENLSYTNLLDLDTAIRLVAEFDQPAAAVVKHATPCGAASAPSVGEALSMAIATDPVARYGCVVAVNRPIEGNAPEALHGVFVDLLAAPSFSSGAMDALSRRPKLKIVETVPPPATQPRWELHSALGRLLVQEADQRPLLPNELRPVTSRTLPAADLATLAFAWKVVRHAKSNAIVLASGAQAVGIGSGQPTRVKAVELAVEVAGGRASGSLLASDAFFPFADGVEAAGKAGVKGILQPGGSVRDTEVIAMADRHGIAMYFTGWRVFRH